ncbi:MAG TPA: glycosyltransferase family 39 protein [Terrimicrobiaceae bacterium]
MPELPWNNLPPARRAALAFGGIAIAFAVILLCVRKPWEAILPPDRELKVIDYVRIYSWWAGAVNCVLLATLAATARWWLTSFAGGLYRLPRPSIPRWLLILTICAMAISGWFGALRLNQSFWDDEVYAMRRAIHGVWKREDDGSIKFRPVKWHETLWFFEKPQHVLHSVITRVVLDTWRAVAKPRGLQFREDVVRFPSYIAGVLSVGSLALLLWRLGFPAAGVIAAFLLAIHPWHIRYASESRAYSLMLFILPLCYVALIEALDSGRWRWWSTYAVALFALMYSNPLNIYPAAGVGLCGLSASLWRWRDPAMPAQTARFFVVTLIAAMAFFQLMLPCVPQFIKYLNTTAVRGELDARWLSSYFSFLFTGAPWSSTGQLVSRYVELYPRLVDQPALFAALAGLSIFLAALGARRLFCGGALHALVTLALFLPAPAAYAISRARHQHLFVWYLLFLLPGLVAAIAMGLDSCRRALPASKAGSTAGVLLVIGLIGGYAVFTTPQRVWLTTRPIQQIRESANATRPTLDPNAKENRGILTASFIGPPDPYDANIIRSDTMPKLAELIARADGENKILFVNFGFLRTAQIRYPSILKALDDPTLFEKIAELQGFEPINDRYVYRYKSGSATGRKLSEEFKSDPEPLENRNDSNP